MTRRSMAIAAACGAAMIGLAACSAADEDAEGLTRAEESELDEAAAALDAAQAEYEATIQSAEPVPEQAAPDAEE